MRPFPWPQQRKVYHFPWPGYILHFQIVQFWKNNQSCRGSPQCNKNLSGQNRGGECSEPSKSLSSNQPLQIKFHSWLVIITTWSWDIWVILVSSQTSIKKTLLVLLEIMFMGKESSEESYFLRIQYKISIPGFEEIRYLSNGITNKQPSPTQKLYCIYS